MCIFWHNLSRSKYTIKLLTDQHVHTQYFCLWALCLSFNKYFNALLIPDLQTAWVTFQHLKHCSPKLNFHQKGHEGDGKHWTWTPKLLNYCCNSFSIVKTLKMHHLKNFAWGLQLKACLRDNLLSVKT